MALLTFKARTFCRPSGDITTAKFPIVMEQPGKREASTGKTAIGPAGKELNMDLQAVGITRNECYVTNVIKDLDEPLSKYIKFSGKNVIVSKKGSEYISLLQTELKKTNSPVIIAMGNVAIYALCGFNKPLVMKRRGSVLDSTLIPGKKIIPVIHTATVIPPKNQYLNRLLIQHDLKRAKEVYEGNFDVGEYSLLTNISYNDALSYLDEVEREGINGSYIDFDIELFNQEVSCISFSYKPGEAICIPFISAAGDYFTVEQETEVWIKIAQILQNIRIKKRGQNVSFDSHFLLRKYGIKARPLDDTMVAQKIIMPDYPVGLDFITSIWTNHPYYKDEGKAWKQTGAIDWNAEWNYNAKDSLMLQEAFPKQYEVLKSQKNIETYNRQRDLIEPLVYMQERGIRVDMEGVKSARDKCLKEADRLQEELNQIAKRDLNPNSHKQLQEYFYGKAGLGLKAYTSRKTKRPTTDDDALKRLSRRGFKEAKLIREIRRQLNIASRYLHPDKFDSDGRIRCSYNPVGTKFSRVSSSANIFGSGMNLQNWPHELLKYLLADEGYIYYSYDLSQAENRIVAYVGDVIPMIEAFEGGKDVHSLTAGLIFNKHPDEISREPGSSNLGDGTHSERFWGKKANHGLNYDLGYKTFSFYYEIPENQGKLIVNRYHQVYPGVRNSFHAYVRRCLRENRTITNLMGRRTRLLGEWGDKLFKEAYSCIPQGTVGDIINERGVNYIYYDQINFGSLELLVQVHDSIGFQIPLRIPFKAHARMLLQIKHSLETSLYFKGKRFVIPADLTIGYSFSKDEGKELKSKEIPNDINLFAQKLEQISKELNGQKTRRLDR